MTLGGRSTGRASDQRTREGKVFELVIAGRVLRTTPEHPFFVEGQGWTPAGELQPGHLLSTATGEWLPVESITNAHQSVTVYNFRVSNYHTYFIAPRDAAFDVWVHNSYTKLITDSGHTTLQLTNKFAAGSYESRQLQRFVRAWNDEIVAAGGSMTRRVLSEADEAASQAWRRQMQRLYPARFSGKVVGHVPDAAAGGPAAGGKAMALSRSVNGFLGGVLKGISEGTVYNSVQLIR
jgi:hypothetical protein